MNKNTPHSLGYGILLAGLLLAGAAHATERSWTTGTDGNWDVGANWTGNVVPGVGESAWMTNQNATYTITYDGDGSQIDYFRLGSANLTTDNIALVIDGTDFKVGYSDESSISARLWRGALLHVKPGASATISDIATGQLDNINLITGASQILVEGDLEIVGGWRIGGGGAISSTVVTNSGSLTFSSNNGKNEVTIGIDSSSSRHTLRIDGGSVEVGANVELRFGSLRATGIIELNSGSFLSHSSEVLQLGRSHSADRGSAQVLVNGGTFTNVLGTTELGVQGATGIANVTSSTSHLFRVTGGIAALANLQMGGTTHNYARNHLEVSGGSMHAANITMGSTGITTNSAYVAGAGTLSVPGTFRLRSAATLQLDGGTTTAGTLQVDPIDDNVLLFNAGTLNVTNATVDTGVETVIGDGTGAMRYKVMGGAHTFAQDLTVNAAATLGVRGAGSIATPMLTFTSGATFELDREGIASEDPFVALSVTGDVTLPESVTVSVSGLSGPAPAEIPLITITGTFAGSPEDWPPVMIQEQPYQMMLDGDTLYAKQPPRGTMILLR